MGMIGSFWSGLRRLTWRNLLIAIHDVLAVTIAVMASFYLRFQDHAFAERLPLLLRILPFFVLLSVAVCYAFRLTTTKWRFISLPEFINIGKTSTVLALILLVLDYIFIAPNAYGTFFFGKTTIVLYWFLQNLTLTALRVAYRYFRYTRTLNEVRSSNASPALLFGRAADAEVLLRGIESGAVKNTWPVGVLSPSRADRGQVIRGIPVLGATDDLADVVDDFSGRERPIKRLVMLPSAFEPDASPEAVLTRARKLGLTVSRLPSLEDSGEAPRLAPVAVEDLLLRPSVKIDYRRLESLVKGKSIVVLPAAEDRSARKSAIVL